MDFIGSKGFVLRIENPKWYVYFWLRLHEQLWEERFVTIGSLELSKSSLMCDVKVNNALYSDRFSGRWGIDLLDPKFLSGYDLIADKLYECFEAVKSQEDQVL